MINRFIILFFAATVLLTACSKPVSAPLMVTDMDTIQLPAGTIRLLSTAQDWKAVLQTVTQPVQLRTAYKGDTMILTAGDRGGYIEGPVTLDLYRHDQHYYYHGSLKNSSSGGVSMVEYRSPKTVNPDSGLQQQRIVLQMDDNRNLHDDGNNTMYFSEAKMTINAKAGTYPGRHANRNQDALSAYYVEPGSATQIVWQGIEIKDKNLYRIMVGPLLDRYGNLVADGTWVRFEDVMASGVQVNETMTRNGKAYLLLHKQYQQHTVRVAVNHIVNHINLFY